MVLAEVDYEAGTWQVKETHNLSGKASGLARGPSNREKFHVRYHGGERYLVGESFPPMVFHHNQNQLEPVVIGNRGRKFPQAQEIAKIMTGSDDPAVIDAWIEANLGSNLRTQNTYLWTDANGDREPQPGEIVLGKLGNVYHGPNMGPYIADDFAVIMGSGDYNPHRGEAGETKFYSSIARFAPASWVDGVPQYVLPATASEMDVAPLYVEPPTDAYIGRAKVRHTF
jgi:hypothetical protein